MNNLIKTMAKWVDYVLNDFYIEEFKRDMASTGYYNEAEHQSINVRTLELIENYDLPFDFEFMYVKIEGKWQRFMLLHKNSLYKQYRE